MFCVHVNSAGFTAKTTHLLDFYLGVFENVVVVAFQSVFYLKMHQNNIFFNFKKLLLTSTYQNDLKTLKKKIIWSKEKNKKILIFLKYF
jgi:hypothetical protein